MDQNETLSALQRATLHLEGQFIYGSNYTFMVLCQSGEAAFKAVYKPSHGERPLWDFPTGTLSQREVAAYLISKALGWDLVPPTVFRIDDAPLGPGSLQLFIDHDPEKHYFNLDRGQKIHLPKVMLFDHLINNADRKAGHILISLEGRLFLIDHGLSFHVEDKLRTVVWDHAGKPIPQALCQDLARVLLELTSGADLHVDLESLLQPEEIAAMQRRGQALLDGGKFPLPPEDRRAYPWPLV